MDPSQRLPAQPFPLNPPLRVYMVLIKLIKIPYAIFCYYVIRTQV